MLAQLETPPEDFEVVVNGHVMKCNKKLIIEHSKYVSAALKEDPNIRSITIDISDIDEKEIDIIRVFFQQFGQPNFNFSNYYFLSQNKQVMRKLVMKLKLYKPIMNSELNFVLSMNTILFDWSNIVFGLSKKNFEQSLLLFKNNQNFPKNQKILIPILFCACIAFPYKIPLYIIFIDNINSLENGIMNLFVDYFSYMYKNIEKKAEIRCELLYLAYGLLKRQKISEKFILEQNQIPLFFVHLIKRKYAKKYHISQFYSLPSFCKQKEELQKNNWELHKIYIEIGSNPWPIARAIEIDDVESLKNMAKNCMFDFNGEIEKSVYQMNSLVCGSHIKLIEYAAFYGSLKCYDFLRENNAKSSDIFKYIVSSVRFNNWAQRDEVKNPRNFLGLFPYSIQFHNPMVFRLILKNFPIDETDYEYIFKFCEYRALILLLGNSTYDTILILKKKAQEYNDKAAVDLIERVEVIYKKFV